MLKLAVIQPNNNHQPWPQRHAVSAVEIKS